MRIIRRLMTISKRKQIRLKRSQRRRIKQDSFWEMQVASLAKYRQ